MCCVLNVLFPVSSSSPSLKPQTHMSASGTSLPDSDWPRPHDPTRPDLPFSHHLPPDPLLSAGSFIDSSSSSATATPISTVPSPTLPSRDLDRTPRKTPQTSSTRRSPLRPDPLNSFNGDSSPSKKVSASNSASSKSALSERPNWLPPGWVVEDRVRSSGATAGTVDKVN